MNHEFFALAFYFVGKDMKERQKVGLCRIPLEDHVIDSYSNFFETGITLLRSSLGSYEVRHFDCIVIKLKQIYTRLLISV